MFFIPTSSISLSLLLLTPIIIVCAQNAPVKVACPKDLIRSIGPTTHPSLSAEEVEYVSTRRKEVLPGAWKHYLQSVTAALPPQASLPRYVSEILTPSHVSPNQDFPTLGLALSGGGLRAAYFAAGVLTSLDGRNKTVPKGTNGVLQAATYLAALSGGAWLTTALVQANFPTIPELVFPTINPNQPPSNSQFGGFLTGVDLLLPNGATGNNTGYLEAVVAELSQKHAAGFPVTIVDAWSRQIARHFVNGTTAANILEEGTHGTGILFSALRNVSTIEAYSQPFPIIIANAIPPTLTANPNDTADIVPGNDVPVGTEIWEINLFETGSWDPSLGSFIPTRFLGSTPAQSGQAAQCVIGFDQASYIAAVSSNIWNAENFTTDILSLTPEGPVLELIESEFPNQPPVRMDAGALPNPFKGINPTAYSASNQSFVALVDGGSNGEVCPLQALILVSRSVDTIFAIDAPSDLANNFANGTDLINTASRAARFGGLYPFPKVPSSAETFVNQGLTSRPVFFGCDEPDVPLLIYLANGAPSATRRALGLPGITNISTEVTTYSPELAQAFMDESFAIATQGLGNNSTDPGAQWSTCLACALVDRTRSRQGIAREGLCATCFTNFCWDGKE